MYCNPRSCRFKHLRRDAKDAGSRLLILSLSPGRKDAPIPPSHVLTGPQGAGCGEGTGPASVGMDSSGSAGECGQLTSRESQHSYEARRLAD